LAIDVENMNSTLVAYFLGYRLMNHLNKTEWLVLLGLLLLSTIPSLGIIRLIELLNVDLNIMPANPRIEVEPMPAVFHIISSITYCIFGAFQFLPNMRSYYPIWHKVSGRVLVLTGVISASSGLWMTHYYAFPVSLQGNLLYLVRITVGLLMLMFILLGLFFILKNKIPQHQECMIRAYAIGQGAGTQSIIFVIWMMIFDEPNGFTRDVLMATAWVVNLALAEWVINRVKLTSRTVIKTNYKAM